MKKMFLLGQQKRDSSGTTKKIFFRGNGKVVSSRATKKIFFWGSEEEFLLGQRRSFLVEYLFWVTKREI